MIQMAFKKLSEGQQELIMTSSQTSDFDRTLSFGVLDNGILLGFVLMRPEGINHSIPDIDTGSLGCRIVKIKVLERLDTLKYMCDALCIRVQIWNEVDQGSFDYMWYQAVDEEARQISHLICGNVQRIVTNGEKRQSVVYRVFEKNNDE